MAATRREFMVGAGAALAAAGTLTGFPAIAQRRPLKVGVFISEANAQGVDELVGPHVSGGPGLRLTSPGDARRRACHTCRLDPLTHYNALMALKAAMERSGEASATGGLAGLDGLTIETATGPLTLDAGGYPTMPLFVATAEGGGQLQVVQKIDQIESGATC